VCGMGANPLTDVVPEFEWMRDHWYVQTRHFRHILIYELRVDGKPLAMPLPARFRDGRAE